MGNCLQVSSKEIAKVVTHKGEVLEFEPWTKTKKVTSGPYSRYNLVDHSRPFCPLSKKAKLEPGGVYYLVPDVAKLVSRKVVREQKCGGSKKIKIVVTREELEMLLGMMCSSESESLGFEEEDESPKWRPSLSSIAEVKGF